MLTNINEYKLDYLKKSHQFFVFNEDGLILDSCNSMCNFSKEINTSTIYDTFLFTLSFHDDIYNLKIGQEIFHESIGMKYREIKGNFDIVIKRQKRNEFSLVIENRTEKNKYWQTILQERNEITIQKEVIERQAKTIEFKNHELEVKNKTLNQFAYTVSHDLKGPSNSIIGLLDLFFDLHKDEISTKALETLTFVKKASVKMSDLITNILEYPTIISNKTESLEFNLKELVEEAYDFVSVPNNVIFTNNCPSIKIDTTKTQLFQVLTNLISNAVKYNNSPKRKITINYCEIKEGIELQVIDNGQGIEKVYHDIIFEMFGTSDSTTSEDSTGIGLAIVKNLTEQNGGKIQVKSELGKGASFIFTWKTNNISITKN